MDTSTILLAIMTLLGGVIALFGTRVIRKANAARDWPAADGLVTTSSTHEFTDSEGSRMYRPDIRYSYRVGGRTYTSETVSLTGVVTMNWREPADRMVATYPQGPCRVFYNPDDHAEACLRPGAHWLYYLMAGIGYLLALVGSVLLLLG